MITSERIQEVVLRSVSEFNAVHTGPSVGSSWEQPLFGSGGQLDSFGLVNLVVTVEQQIEEEFGVVVALADERALSERHSPFRSLGALRDYVAKILPEDAR